MADEKRVIISEKTAYTSGAVVLIITAVVSWTTMYTKVLAIEKLLDSGNYEKRITVLETTIPQINQSLSEIKELLKK